jgi:hypothetical protein
MREIVRMTAQKHPLEVNVPLFSFPHRTNQNQQQHGASMDAGSSLQNGQMYHQSSNTSDRTLSPANMNEVRMASHSMNGANGAWPMRNISASPGQHNLDLLSNTSNYIGNGL